MMMLAVFLSVSMFSCKDKKDAKPEVIQPVKVFRVDSKAAGLSTKVFTGLVKESREVKLAFQIPGPLIKLNVDEGQFVKKGEVVAILDDRDYQVQFESASANYENAKLQAERYAALYEKRSTSKSIHDQMQASYKLAKAQMEAAENALKDTRIYAPFSGYVQSMFVENFEKVGAGQPIVSLLDLSNLELAVALSENDFLQNKAFDAFSCQFENFPGISFDLKLIEIEKKPNGDNFFRMRLGIDTQDKQLVPGMVASVTTCLKSTCHAACKVPVESVFSDKGKSYVWVYDMAKNCVKRHEVQLTDFDSNGMINISEGIANGDMIVAAGVHSLREGQKVKMLSQKSNSNIGGQL